MHDMACKMSLKMLYYSYAILWFLHFKPHARTQNIYMQTTQMDQEAQYQKKKKEFKVIIIRV